MMRSFLALLLVAPLTGCAAFLIQPEDSTARKAAKVTARVPLALVSAGSSEVAYYCARGMNAPASFAVYGGEDAVPGQPEERLDRWARLTPDERLDKCWEQIQTDWANSGLSNSAFSNPPAWGWMDPSTHAEHHRHGHHHHPGC